ncbi:MAG: hypothetical protein ACXVPD_09005 [Bacteroidia bacterium]
MLGLYAVREALYAGLRKNKAGVFEKYTTIFLKENNYDVLFMGSSRAETAFDPRLFDSITRHNSYNIGVTGATPRIAFKVLKAYLHKSKAPDYLVFDLDFHFLKYGVDTVRYFPRYFPFLSNPVLLKEFNGIDPRFSTFRRNPVWSLPFSNMRLLSASLHGWMNKPGKFDTCYYKGFENKVLFDTLKSFAVRPFHAFINPQERAYIDSIIGFCAKNRIRLLLLTSPMYNGAEPALLNKSQVTRQLRDIAVLNGLDYTDFSKTPVSFDRRNFTDPYHLTGRGARNFTVQFSGFFSQYFDKKSVR